MFKDYISELTRKRFIEEIEVKRKRYFQLTQKGFEFLEKYKIIVELVEGFGL